MKWYLASLCLLMFAFSSCNSTSDEKIAQTILADVNLLQDKQDLIAKEMLAKPNIFSNENINGFPNNRASIETTANQQIDSLNQIIEIDNEQINKLKMIENLKFDKNFLEFSKLNRQIFEKRLESKKLGVQKFQLILDKNLIDKVQLEENISAIKQKESEIDSEINQLENQKQNVRKSAGK